MKVRDCFSTTLQQNYFFKKELIKQAWTKMTVYVIFVRGKLGNGPFI